MGQGSMVEKYLSLASFFHTKDTYVFGVSTGCEGMCLCVCVYWGGM